MNHRYSYCRREDNANANNSRKGKAAVEKDAVDSGVGMATMEAVMKSLEMKKREEKIGMLHRTITEVPSTPIEP